MALYKFRIIIIIIILPLYIRRCRTVIFLTQPYDWSGTVRMQPYGYVVDQNTCFSAIGLMQRIRPLRV